MSSCGHNPPQPAPGAVDALADTFDAATLAALRRDVQHFTTQPTSTARAWHISTTP